MYKYLKLFVLSNVTIIATLLFLPAFLVTNDISVIQELIQSISREFDNL
jgi:HAMP domain-containing protein